MVSLNSWKIVNELQYIVFPDVPTVFTVQDSIGQVVVEVFRAFTQVKVKKILCYKLKSCNQNEKEATEILSAKWETVPGIDILLHVRLLMPMH